MLEEDFDFHVSMSVESVGNLAELAWHEVNMMELSKQSQQNIVPDPMVNRVDGGDALGIQLNPARSHASVQPSSSVPLE